MVIGFTEQVSVLQGLDLDDRIVLFHEKESSSPAQTDLQDKET